MTDTRDDLDRLSPEEKRALLRELLKNKKAAENVTRFPLSYGQKSLWMVHHLAPESAAYNSPITLRLRARTARFDIDAFIRTLEILIQRHSVFRTRYSMVDGVPMQEILPGRKAELDEIDASSWTDEELTAYLLEQAYQPIDLSSDRIDRWTLLRRSDREHILQLVVHHMVLDMWSGGLLMDEMRQIYDAEARGVKATLSPPTAQYVDYVRWQNQLLEGPEGEALWQYWKQQLDGDLSLLEMPTDRPRPPAPTYAGAAYNFVLGPDLVAGLKALSRDHGVTLFTTLLSAFQVLLHRYSGQDDILVGAPMAGRSQPWAAGAVGYFANTVPIRGDLSGDPPFAEFLERMLDKVLGALKHQDYPFQLLQERLQESRGNLRAPLVRVMFALEQLQRWNLHSLGAAVPTEGMSSMNMGGVDVEVLPLEERTSQFELMLMAEELEGTLSVSLKYNTDLYDAATIERLAGHFENLLKGIIAYPEMRVSELPLISPAERDEILGTWSGAAVPSGDYPTIVELFEQRARQTPDTVAVTSSAGTLTYADLDQRANSLAHFLSDLGVGSGDPVVLCVDRSPEFIVSLLGTLKAGAAYVPLDPTDPPQRVSRIVEDVGATVLLSRDDLSEMLPESGVALVSLDADWSRIAQHPSDSPRAPVQRDSRACVLYVSSPTGDPRGVELTHANLVAAACAWEALNPTGAMTTLHVAAISSGAAQYEVWGPLLSGGRLVLYPPYRPSAEELAETIRAHDITTLRLSADAFQDVARTGVEALSGLRHLMIDGDMDNPLSAVNALSSLPDCSITRVYGEVESASLSCAYAVSADDAYTSSLPLGRPVPGAEAYVLDERCQPAPIGIPGELYLGGAGIGRDFLASPETTEDVFIPHPFKTGERLFRTQVRARFRADGTIEPRGTVGDSVRVEDFLVHPAEVERALAQHRGIRECVVMGWTDDRNQRRLVAYILTRKERPSEGELRVHLQSMLPGYMVPSTFIYLDAFPTNEEGAVDRSALPLPLSDRAVHDANFVAPETMLQSVLQRIWEEVLHIHPIGIRDDFFELGGHSFLALRLLERIEHVLGVQVTPTTLGQAPTIEQLATVIENESDVDLDTHLVAIQESGTKPPFFFSRGHREGPSLYAFGMGKQLGEDRPYYILQPGRLDTGGKQPSIQSLAADFLREIRAIQPHGPYYLGGHCEGGVLSFEMARQLEAAGEKVGLVVLVNTVMWIPQPRWPFVALQRGASLLRLSPGTQVEMMIRLQEAAFQAIRLRRQGIRTHIRALPHHGKQLARRILRRQSGVTAKPAQHKKGRGATPSGGESAVKQYEAQRDAVWELHARAVRAYVPSTVRGPVRAIAPADEPYRRFRDMQASEASTQIVAPDFDIRRFPGKRAAYVVPHRVDIGEQIRDWLENLQPANQAAQ